ncbi:MAG: hypothetical protein IAE82_12570 [Opitutaceae bacterium]|nr:hypothetical protein [Opitutaceae bacterium]
MPARIGIARIEDGRIMPIPGDEWTTWRALQSRLTPALGELSPVTAVVAQSLTTAPVSRTPHDAITHLRLAAAREHLDAILLYEITTTHSMEQTELSLLDATIVGAWWFPVHKSHLAAHASATLIDVRSGLSYGSAIGHASDVCSAALLGSEEKRIRQRMTTVRQSVDALATEVDGLMTRIAQSPARPAATAGTPATTTAPHPTLRTPPTARVEPDRIIPAPEVPAPESTDGEAFWGGR